MLTQRFWVKDTGTLNSVPELEKYNPEESITADFRRTFYQLFMILAMVLL